MILLYGRADDTPLRLTREAARTLGVDHRMIDQSQLRHHHMRLEIGATGPGGWLRLAGEHIALERISGVFARPLAVAEDPWYARRALAFHETFLDWLDCADATVANRPSQMHSNTSKPYQSQLIAAAGFAVPDTLVTDDPEQVHAFRQVHGRVVFKSISGIRSIVSELNDDHSARLDQVRALPTQFQAYVPGVDLRVHVVGEEVFATEIVSEVTDYRYGDRAGAQVTLRPTTVPPDVAGKCVALAASLGLTLCGIDLRRRPDGEHVCFEANPMPAFSYYETHTGQAISSTLVGQLASDGNGRSKVSIRGILDSSVN
jgi:RimK-like ATP-grasp domain